MYKVFFLVLGGFMMLSGIFIEDNIGQFTLMIVGVFFLLCRIVFPILPAVISKKEPILDSYFKLMLSGGDRKFKFNKSDETSIKIADFINKVEDTLTAYK